MAPPGVPPTLRRVTDVRLPSLVAACALGGALGSLARWGVAEAWPGGPSTWPWATFTVNVVGCLLLGLLLGSPLGQDPLRRVFLGSGVLGGFTTFSTYALQVKVVTDDGHGGRRLPTPWPRWSRACWPRTWVGATPSGTTT